MNVDATQYRQATEARQDAQTALLTTIDADTGAAAGYLATMAGIAEGEMRTLIAGFEDEADWTVLNDETESKGDTTTHITGEGAVSFAKVTGDTVIAGLKRAITAIDLSDYVGDSRIGLNIYLSSIADVVSVEVRLGTDISNTQVWKVLVKDLVAGWNLLSFPVGDVETDVGAGWNDAVVTYAVVAVNFSAVTDTLAGIIVDNLSMRTAGAETVRAKIAEASATKVATDRVMMVQQLDEAGKVPDWDKAAVPLAGETAESATERSVLSLLKRTVNKLIDNKAYLATLVETGAKGLELHPCDAPGAWERYNDATDPTLAFDHITGTASIEWNKEDGNYTRSAILSDSSPQVDIGNFAADDFVAVTFKCPDNSALDYVELLVGTNNTQFWAYKWDGSLVPDDKWVTLYVKLSDYDWASSRVFPAEIKFFRFSLVTNNATDTITAIKLDRIAIVSAEAAYAATHGFAPSASNALTAVETTDAEWKSITLTEGATGAYWSLSGSSAYVVCQTATPTDADIGAIFQPNIPYFWKTRGRTKIWIRKTASAEAKIHVTDEM